MTSKTKYPTSSFLEVLFQIVLHILVFVFYSFERNSTTLEPYKFFFFLNYAVAAFFINYFLLSRFYYQKKTLQFVLLIIVTVAAVIIIEEFVLEPIFFTGNRAETFGGVLFTLTDVLPVIAILSGFKFAWDALGKQREVDELKTAVKESELQFLKSQINPHFLFNNLNNLYAYAIEQSPKTPEIILELSGVLRYMLYECKEDFVPLKKEVAQLENFVNLSEMQIEERGEVKFVAKNIQTGFQIAPLILTVFIENAFKHSTASQSENIIIEVKVELLENGKLDFNCKNSFQVQTNLDDLSGGIGLENVKKRLELIYPNAHDLNIQSKGGFYEVQLTIDLNKTA